jgi:superfamily II DNA or RNA helicase
MKNNIRLKLTRSLIAYKLPPKILRKIKDDLTILNPVWLENRKMGRRNWQVEKYLFFYTEPNSTTINLPIGYAAELQSMLTKYKLIFDITDLRKEVPCQFKFEGTLKNLQEKAINDLMMYETGTLCAPTGSGKTVMALFMIAARGQRTLIIVHTKELLDQWINRCGQFLKMHSNEIGIIGAGQERLGDRITIALVQSLYKRVHQYKNTFGHVIVDECHRAPSRTFSEAIGHINAMYSLGLSATPFRRDGLNKVIFMYIGPLRHTISKSKLIEDGSIMQAQYIIRSTMFLAYYTGKHEYSKMLTELAKDKERNEMICFDAVNELKTGDSMCLILIDRKIHAIILSDIFLKKYGITCDVLTSDVPIKERRFIVERMNQGKNRLVIATGSLIGEGFDCKQLTTLFIASPISYIGRIIQYIGRVMRPCQGKSKALVYDYADWRVTSLARQAKKRIKFYGKQNVTYLNK